MANLGSTDTPIAGESFGLPSGWALTENAAGEVVIEDSGGNVVFRRDETAGEWVTDSIDAESVDVEERETENVAAELSLGVQQTVTGGDRTQVELDTVEKNHISDAVTLDTSNNKIVIDEAGTYTVHGSVQTRDDPEGNRFGTRTELNGATLRAGLVTDGDAFLTAAAPPITQQFDVNDELTLSVQFRNVDDTVDHDLNDDNATTFLEVVRE